MSASNPEAYASLEAELAAIRAELAARDAELAASRAEFEEARTHQAATAEILQVISSSVADAQPVFEKILDSCQALFDVDIMTILLARDDGQMYMAAHRGPGVLHAAEFGSRPIEETGAAQAILERRAVHIPDASAVVSTLPPSLRAVYERAGNFSGVVAPLLRDGVGIGSIGLWRVPPKPFTDKEIALLTTFADQAVIAIENARLFREAQEALERQTATSDVLQVISQSPTDLQPVFDAIADRARVLCHADRSAVTRFDGDQLHLVAFKGHSPASIAANSTLFPTKPGPGTLSGRAVIAREPVQYSDYLNDPELQYHVTDTANTDYASGLAVPLLQDDRVLGTISVGRSTPGVFSDNLVSLLQIFAAQAVIAIENVRLFGETREALEQQTASAEVLSVISSSVADTQPVFEKILDSCQALFGLDQMTVTLVDEHGQVHAGAWRGEVMEEAVKFLPRPAEETITGQAILERRVIHIPDASAVVDTLSPTGRAAYAELGNYSAVFAPLLREGHGIGAIALFRVPPKPFSDKEIALLATFADQAVIAIENARLFRETQEALERQTATAEILQVISESPTDVQPVFDAIVERAIALTHATIGVATRFDGERLHLASFKGVSDVDTAPARAMFPIAPSHETLNGRAALARTAVQIPDFSLDTDYRIQFRDDLAGSALAVPLLREGQVLGTIMVTRPGVGTFSHRLVNLLQTFAAQAVIAIENVRLFNETREALDRQTATADILGVISSSPTDVQPVYEKILDSCGALFGVADMSIGLIREDGQVHVAAWRGEFVGAMIKVSPATPFEKSATAYSIRERRALHVAETSSDMEPSWPYLRAAHDIIGRCSFLMAPLLHGDHGIGSISLVRQPPKPFSDKEIALLSTFASQAAIAIENVRLFNGTTDALDRQTAISDILRVTTESPSDVQPVLDAIGDHALRLCDAASASIFLIESDHLRHVTSRGPVAEQALSLELIPIDRTSTMGRAILERRTVHVEDIQTEGDEYPLSFEIARRLGYRTILAAPLFREGKPFGAVLLLRQEVRPFSGHDIALLRTFGDQAAIALENVRLFKETHEALERQTATAGVLSVIGSSVEDTAPVFEKILDSCEHLFNAEVLAVILVKDGMATLAGGRTQVSLDLSAIYPVPVDDVPFALNSPSRLAIHIPDSRTLKKPTPTQEKVREQAGDFSSAIAPMVLNKRVVGYVVAARVPPQSFTDNERGLLQTFADQAVIAIENARLFHEIEDKSQQLEAANQHKSEFLANMSHELRTPLNAVIGFSEVLLERMFGELNEKQDDYLQDILSSGKHLLSLITDILDLSKIEAGRMELELETFDVTMALDNTLTLIRERAQQHGIGLSLEVEPDIGEICADQRKLKQIMLNLLSNAVKFTPDGGQISVRAILTGGVLEVAVADTGIGIAPEDQDTVFQEFRQVGGQYTNKQEGTGLGLALTRRFVELHGGTLTLESEPGRGSTFTFTIPRQT